MSAVTLRRSYSATLVTHEDHTLITHGIYRHVRHPVYLGVLIAVLAMPLLLSSFFGIIVVTLLTPLILRLFDPPVRTPATFAENRRVGLRRAAEVVWGVGQHPSCRSRM